MNFVLSAPLVCGLAVRLGFAAAALTCASGASASGGAYSFQIVNDTASGGDPDFLRH